MKKKIGELVFQIVPVMIGVYLGFVFSNWSEERKTKLQTEHLRNNLIAEIQTNKSRIENDLDYHTMLRDSSRFYSNANKFDKMPTFFKGTHTLTLTNSAFDTGMQTGLINNLKIEEIQDINELYTLQSAYKEFNMLLLSGLITKDFEESDQGIIKFCSFLAATMTDVVTHENMLLNNYEELIKKLKDE